MNLNYHKLSYYLILFFCVFTLIFPVLVLNKVFFVLILILILINISKFRIKTLSPLYILLIFSYGFLLSLFNNVDKELSLQFYLTSLVLLLIYPIIYYKINFDIIVKMSGLILALYSLFSYVIIVVFDNLTFSNQYYLFFKMYSSGNNSLRIFTDEGLISFHVGTLPFLYLSLFLYIESYLFKKSIFIFLIISLHFYIIFLSGSRGTFFTSIIALLFLIFYSSKSYIKFLLLVVIVPFILYLVKLIADLTNIFSTEEGSNNVKLGHLQSFLDNINFIKLMFGDGGLGSYYFSKGTNSYLAHTEITPIDMIRYLGLILTLLLYKVIFFPINSYKSYFGNNIIYFIVFLIYVINSFTNPTMFNSYGLLVVLWYWYKILMDKKEIKLNNSLIKK
jgi:hypothetical protein